MATFTYYRLNPTLLVLKELKRTMFKACWLVRWVLNEENYVEKSSVKDGMDPCGKRRLLGSVYSNTACHNVALWYGFKMYFIWMTFGSGPLAHYTS